jgi:hypothetical protein
MQKRKKGNNPPNKRKHHAHPQKHHTRHRPRILSVPQRRRPIRCHLLQRRVLSHARNPHTLSSNNVRIRQCTCQRRSARHQRARFPRAFYSARLGALGPEEVEEEGGPKDGGDVDADEDVEGGDANVGVVVGV